jgi:Mg2+/Co2+ transporter CorC
MTHREYGDRTSFVTEIGAISDAEVFFGDIEDEHDKRETSIENLAKRADDVQGRP